MKRTGIMTAALLLAAIVTGPRASLAGDPAPAIRHLIRAVAASGCTFLRNGEAHTAERAAAHLQTKYMHFRERIRTPEDFIRLAGTKSLLSGRPYRVRLPDGREMYADVWLREILRTYRQSLPAP